jgi:tRNA(Ile)-lysidine synthase
LADVARLSARCTFPPAGTAVDCAVSGGPDSTALLVLALAAGCVVTAIHVDHGLREGSAAEASTVAATSARFGAAFTSRCAALADGPNLEARARDARYALLPDGVLTGHTADDQAETMLINLVRGAAGSGLAGMRPSAQHPLLALRRSETHELCAALRVPTVTDPSNADPRHLRNRVRAEVLPLLDAIARRDLVPVLTRQADLLRADSDLLDDLARTLDPTDAAALTGAPLPLARRAVRQWLTGRHPPDAATVERVLAVARGDILACELPGGDRIERHRQRLSRHGASLVPGKAGVHHQELR